MRMADSAKCPSVPIVVGLISHRTFGRDWRQRSDYLILFPKTLFVPAPTQVACRPNVRRLSAIRYLAFVAGRPFVT